MSGNMRNQPNERQEKSRSATDDMEQKHYEGFEGMNYEQARIPYKPQYISTKNRREQAEGKDGDIKMRLNP